MKTSKNDYAEKLEKSFRTKVVRVVAFLGGCGGFWAIYQAGIGWMTPVHLVVGAIFIAFGIGGYGLLGKFSQMMRRIPFIGRLWF